MFNAQFMVTIGVIIQLIGTFLYIRNIITREVRTSVVTWLVWSLSPFVVVFAVLSNGESISVIPIMMLGLSFLILFFFSLSDDDSYVKVWRNDYLSIFFLLLALYALFISKSVNASVIFSILSYGSASLTTLIKTWQMPFTEPKGIYAASFINALIALAVASEYSFPVYVFSIYILLFSFVMLYPIIRKNPK